MKHGPIALIDKNMPVLALMPKDQWYEKMLSQVEQVKARGGRVILVATDGDQRAAELADDVFWIPEAPGWSTRSGGCSPANLCLPDCGHERLDVDQPRNLAKSVTVE